MVGIFKFITLTCFLSVINLVGCHEFERTTQKELLHIEIIEIGPHQLVILSDNEQHKRIVEIVARNSLMRAEETFCELIPQSIVLYDFSNTSTRASVRLHLDQLGNGWVSMPFYLKNLTSNPHRSEEILKKNIEKNLVLQHEIGHVFLTYQFPQEVDSESDYGSSLPDWIDEMAAMLHDGSEQGIFRKLHFEKIMNDRLVISPLSLIAFTRDKDPFRPKMKEGGKKVEYISITNHADSSNISYFYDELPVEEYYVELAMLLKFFRSIYGDTCLVDRFISDDIFNLPSEVTSTILDLSEADNIDAIYKKWILNEFRLTKEPTD